jgi:hypothetical protein
MPRFFRRGKTQLVFTQTVANQATPHVGEITGGVNLSGSIHDLAGFSFKNTPIETPVLSASFTAKIPGPDVAEDVTLKYYRDSTSNPLDITLAKDTIGYVIIGDYKVLGTWAPGDTVDVWPVQVGSNAKDYSVGNDPALSTVVFTVINIPSFNVTVGT